MTTAQPRVEPIAIIGMAGRFPDARNIQQFWQNLINGLESLKVFTEDEVKSAGIDPSWISIPGYVHAGSVLDDIEMFDAPFFGFSARDAEIIDPQQRLFLEVAWESLENAGHDADSFPGEIAVFGGSEQSTYLYQLIRNPDRLAYTDPTVLQIGNDKDYLTTQVSYKLNLRGPSAAVQTACSTSLVAVALACQTLQAHQSDVALAGGVSVGVPQKKGYWYQPGGIFSPDGHCRTFDAAGQGTVVGNGVGMVVLRRLSDALADGDRIHAVILGTGINNDGSLKVGFSAPSVEGQVRAIRGAQKMGGVDPETIGYVEAHGTATLLGDPIEFTALNDVFRARSKKKGWCAIGSLKSNVGHLASAAGVAGLIKTVLCLKNRTLVPSLNFKTPNPQINFAESPFYVNTEVRPWEANGTPRRAGISSFGVGGTNAHVVLEEAPAQEASGPSRSQQLVLISARTDAALDTATDNLARHLRDNPDVRMADVAFTTQTGRKAFGRRRILFCEENGGAVTAAAALEDRDPARVMNGVPVSHDKPVVFLFSGQGTQYVNMALDLYRHEAHFREELDRCCELLRTHLSYDLCDVLYPQPGGEEEATAALTRTSMTQPALFTIEYAMASLWMHWGVKPKAMIGHSIGEYVAACLAGVFRLEDALQLVAMRGQLMESMPRGSMLAVPLSQSEAEMMLHGGLCLAAVNAPYMSVLSGPTPDIDRMASQLSERGLQVRKLHTSHAFHSSMMDPILDEFRSVVSSIERTSPRIPFISNVTGTWINNAQIEDPDYWNTHLRSAVQFSAGLKEALQISDATFLEIGPGRTLQTFVRQQPGIRAEHTTLSSIRAAQEQQSDVDFLLNTLGQLWLTGTRINWRAFSSNEKRRRAELPTYPFERQRYWIGISDQIPAVGGSAEADTSKDRDISEWFYTPTWKPAVSDRGSRDGKTQGRWLVYCDGLGLGETIAGQLRDSGSAVITISPGAEFTQLGDDSFIVRPDKSADYQALIKQVCSGGAPTNIVHLWSVTSPSGEPHGFDDYQALGYSSLLYTAQALQKQNVTSPIQAGFVVNRLHIVSGDEAVDPPKATALGACKVLPQEYPNLRLRAIDVVLDADASREKLAGRIINELTSEPFEPVAAYRKDRRWVQTYEPSKLTGPVTPGVLRESGVYLITGGLGNIGLTIAESLARTVHAKLILTGRSAFPDRDQWEQWVKVQGDGDPVSRKIQRLLALESLGAQVAVYSADSSDSEQMREIIAQAEERFGSVNGVIHGAGNTSADGFVNSNQVDAQVSNSQFQPKAVGMIVLEEILRDRPIDFYLLLSSISGVLGGLNLLPYASANLFLDAFAAARNQDGGIPFISVNWDAWQFPADEKAYKSATPNWKEYILPSEGSDAFLRALDRAATQIVVSATPLDERIRKWVKLETLREMQSGAAKASSMHPRPNLSSQYIEPRTPTEQKIAAIWQNLLGVAPIGIYDKFFELGGHSLLAIQLISTVRETFQVEVPPQRLFEAPTIAAFAASIEADIAASKQMAEQQEQERVAELLNLVEGLSDEEVAALLADPEQLAAKLASNG